MMTLPGRLVKRAMDLGLSTLLILGVLSWLLPILALLIKLDSRGPAFFIQKRRKKGMGSFGCIKLRTMRLNPEADRRIALGHDERITRLGRWLRSRVKPGITGLAQASGYFGATGNLAAMEKRLHLDILYVREWSPVLDLQILASTLRWVWMPETPPLKPSFHGS